MLASVASAQTTRPTVSTDLGFGGVFKPEAWLPVYVNVADAQPRPVTFELRTARFSSGHQIDVRVHTNAQPTTFTLYAPPAGTPGFGVGGERGGITLQVREASGRVLFANDLTETVRATPAAPNQPVFGVAGTQAIAERVASRIAADASDEVAAGALRTPLLPDRPIGYAAIDVLVLPELNVESIDNDVETAIVCWVRAGGIVVTWPGSPPPTGDSPLRDLLPATFGDLAEHPVLGRTVVSRAMQPVNDPAVRELSEHDNSIFERRVGLGQIVLCSFDPTTLPGLSPGERVDLWRRLTSGQLRLANSERRNGLFDPLVAQARGEEQLTSTPTPHSIRPWLLAGLLVSLALGPGELMLLAAARRHPRTPLTILGLLGTVGFAIAAATYHAPVPATPNRIVVDIETDDGRCISIGLTDRLAAGDPTPEVLWLSGEGSDPTRQPSGELRLEQREPDAFAIPDQALLNIDSHVPLAIRSLEFAGAKPAAATLSLAGDELGNGSEQAWSAVAIAAPDGVAESGPLGANASIALPTPAAAASPSAGRHKTGIEQLAERPGWEPILMDRTLASRLVQLQEFERATIRVARSEQPGLTRYVVHVSRS